MLVDEVVPPPPAITDPLESFARELAAIVDIVGHGERFRILAAARNAPAHGLSPVEHARTSAMSLGSVAYHFRGLVARGLLEEAGTERRRGAIAHFYALTRAGNAALDQVDALRHVA